MPGVRSTPSAHRVRRAAARAVCSEALQFARAQPAESFDLIYVDPPFCTGKARGRATGGRFADAWPGGLKEYLRELHPHLAEFHRLLPPRGTLWVHLDWRAAHYVKIQLDTIFGAENFLNEIIWHYRTGGAGRRWFARKHDTILVYARRLGRHQFFPQRGGAYRTDGLRRDAAGRPFKSTRRGRLYFHADGPLLSDVWDVPFLSTVSRERVAWPTQKPLALLERIIAATTRPGQRVGDFFCGSGTTLVAAARLGRCAVGCDRSAEAVRLARRRLDRLRDDR